MRQPDNPAPQAREPWWVVVDRICCKFCCLYGLIYVLIALVCFILGSLLIHSVVGAILAMLVPGCAVLFIVYKKYTPLIHTNLILLWGLDMVLFIIAWQIVAAFGIYFIALAVGESEGSILGSSFKEAEEGEACSVMPGYFFLFLFNAYILAALVEEGMKYVLARHASRSAYIVSRKCVPLYTLCFCMFFGMYENIAYILASGGSGAAYATSFMRVCLPMHPFWGVMTAAYHEQSRYLKQEQPTWFGSSWRSMLLHGTFDFCAFSMGYLFQRNCGDVAIICIIGIIAVVVSSFLLVRKAVAPLWDTQDVLDVHHLIAQGQLPVPQICCHCWICTQHRTGPGDNMPMMGGFQRFEDQPAQQYAPASVVLDEQPAPRQVIENGQLRRVNPNQQQRAPPPAYVAPVS